MIRFYALTFVLFLWLPTLFAQGGVVVYDGTFNQGYKAITADWNMKEGDLIWNDRISSISVADGYQAEVYKHHDFKGEKLLITSKWEATGDFAGWNNQISSIKIVKRPEEYSMVYTCKIWYDNSWQRFDDFVLASNGVAYMGTRPIKNQTVEGTVLKWQRSLDNAYDGELNVDGKKIVGWINHPSIGRVNLNGELYELRKDALSPITSRAEPEKASTPAPPTTTSTPAPVASQPAKPVMIGQIKIYKSNNFTGESKIITSNWNPKNYPENLDWGGKVNSIKVSEGWAIRIYSMYDYKGSYIDITDDWTSAGNREWTDEIGSIKIVRKARGFPNQVSGIIATGIRVYKSNNFSGESKYVSSNWNPRNYPENLDWGGKVNSIKVPEGWWIRLYSMYDYKGDYLDITDDWTSSGNRDWTDEIGSIKIMAKPKR